ncbi:MAG: ribonuclease III [Candidatus Ranarchaeia archaeon]
MLTPERKRQLKQLSDRLGLEHKTEFLSLLAIATTHPSIKNKAYNYERLEFLGDSVLGFIISDLLYRRKLPITADTEGELTKAKSKLTRDSTLASVAEHLGLDEYIEVANGYNWTPRVCADVLEAIFGACYLAYGIKKCRDFLVQHLDIFIDQFDKVQGAQDNPKNRLQELVQHQTHHPPSRFSGPTYKVIGRSGPDHAPEFHVRVSVKLGTKKYSATGLGHSKMEAEMEAARKLLDQIS